MLGVIFPVQAYAVISSDRIGGDSPIWFLAMFVIVMLCVAAALIKHKRRR